MEKVRMPERAGRLSLCMPAGQVLRRMDKGRTGERGGVPEKASETGKRGRTMTEIGTKILRLLLMLLMLWTAGDVETKSIVVNYPDLSWRFEVGACNCPVV